LARLSLKHARIPVGFSIHGLYYICAYILICSRFLRYMMMYQQQWGGTALRTIARQGEDMAAGEGARRLGEAMVVVAVEGEVTKVLLASWSATFR